MDETRQILQMLERGTISADEAHQLLMALERDPEKRADTVYQGSVEPTASSSAPSFRRYRLVSCIPFGLALAVLLVCSWWTYVLYRHAEGRVTLEVAILLVVTVLAFLLAAVTLWMSAAPWLHVRVRDQAGHRIAISLPLPLTLAYWGLCLAQRFVHDESVAHLDAAAQMIQAMRTSQPGPTRAPITVDVNDGDERVQVYIG